MVPIEWTGCVHIRSMGSGAVGLGGTQIMCARIAFEGDMGSTCMLSRRAQPVRQAC